ncbi:acyltransferase family protein [Sunxiuqinia sp. A32]|uniref:acyltransferase family protein n=1 Tax=Sunxiuqinia sp. A32 TaxID=3461496 RepID=UPI00404525D0
MKTRIYFLDNLRTFLILMVVVLHSGLVYEHVLQNSWIVVDPVKCNEIGLIRMYLDLFVMFSIFFISGYFVRFSVVGKSSWEFIKSKLKRIMLPWLIAVLTLIPAFKAIFLYSRGLPQEEWFSYFHFFERAGTDLSFYANNPVQNWLWFLPVLFTFQLIYLGLSRIHVLSMKISLKTGVALTFLVSVIYGVIISSNGLNYWTHNILFHFQNERLVVYFATFLLGSLCNKLGVFDSNKKNTKWFVISNIVLTVALGVFTAVALNLFFNIITPGRNYFYISESIDRILYYTSATASMLSFLHVLIHTFRFSFNKVNPLMRQLNKSSYSVYIIHTIVLGVVALTLLPFAIPAFIKFLILSTLTFTISNMIIYSYQKAMKHTYNYKTVVTAMVVIFTLTVAFKRQEQSAQPEENQPELAQTEQTPQTASIHAAIVSGNLEAVKQIIQDKSRLDEREPAGGSSPLISAIVFDKTEIALTLINAGADVNFKNNDGSTPLHTAAFFCRTEIVQALLENGADKTIQNNAGSTAFESVSAPFEMVKPIYDYFSKVYAPLGLTLDYEHIQTARPKIAGMVQ